MKNIYNKIRIKIGFTAIISMLFTLQVTAQKATLKIVGVGKAVNPYQYITVKKATFNKAGVASAHPIASEIGAAIMKKGGNAFDAAIATQLALAVVYPQAGNIGGGGFLVAKTAKGKTIALDYREKAPAKANRNMYLDAAGNAQTQLSQNGHLAAGVPGTISGLLATLPYAKLPFAELIQPAIDVAEFGFAITKQEANNLNNHRKLFVENSTNAFPFVKLNGDWKEGDTLIQTDLANTLKRVRDFGAKGFYEGKTAELIEAEMQAGKGIISKDDLKNYQTAIRKPLSFNYKGLEIVGMPPPSSGGIILLQLMKMMEKKPLQQYGFQSTKAVQVMVEAERRAYADRAAHMGDPDFWKVPLKTLQSDT
ncbi:MAG: gamma-glutamyltransferase family protein, partial [Chitinophagaceae bacterium]